MQHVVIETVFFVPQLDTFAAAIVHRMRDMNKMLQKFARHTFVRRVFVRQFQCNREHIQAIHSHPASTIRLLEVTSGWQWSGAIENSDVVQAKKSALKNIHSFGVFAVHPPGEVE